MRTLLATLFLIAAPNAFAAEDETAPIEAESPAPAANFPDQLTPEALADIADRLDELSRERLVSGTGGRATAEARRADSFKTMELAEQLKAAANALQSAQNATADAAVQLSAAQAQALEAAKRAISEMNAPQLERELAELAEPPQELPPEPVTHVFCMEASGAGPRTFSRFATDSLTENLPYVQGYITHDLTQVAPFKLRLRLMVEHDATAAPFATLDALQVANQAAVDEMNDPARRAAETILMGELAEQLCATTPANP